MPIPEARRRSIEFHMGHDPQAKLRAENAQLRAAAERALRWAKDFHCDNQREVIFELEDALGVPSDDR